jgi:hypothetical protein
MRDVPLPFADGAIDLLLRLERDGFRLRADGDTLFVEPGHRLTPADGQAIRDHKTDILAYLVEYDERAGIAEFDGNLSRSDAEALAVAQILTPAAQGRLDAMIERGSGDCVPVASDGPHGLGACFSCGEALGAGREYGRCPACQAAANVRYREAQGFVDPFDL